MLEQFVAAIRTDDVEKFQMVIEKTHINLSYDLRDVKGQTPLILAAQHGSLKCLAFLLENGAVATIDAVDPQGDTALMAAAEKGNKECVELLLENGVNISMQDKYGNTALSLAERGNHAECAGALEAYSADVDESVENMGDLLELSEGMV